MAVYKYSGFNSAGKSVSGLIDAPHEKGAMDRLGAEGIVPTALALESAEGTASGKTQAAGKKPGGRVPMVTRTLFIRELATFINADIPLLEAIDVLRLQEHNPTFKGILDDLHNHVQGGDSFSRAMTRFPKIFPTLLVSMVRVGETGGMLGQVLEQMSVWMERDEEVRSEIRGAMAYPMMIMIFGMLSVFVLLSFVLPRIVKIFESSNAPLPTPTKILMSMSGFMSQYWWLVLLGCGGLIVLARWLMAKPEVKAVWDRAVLYIPVAGVMVQKSSIARFARACGALLAAGVPLLEALRVVRDLMGNGVMAAAVDGTIEKVTRGMALSKTLGESRWFPQSVVHLLGVGERTGKLGDMFDRVATTFENQTRGQIKVLLNMLSPLLILGLAVVVALIAAAILLPIFKMSSVMH
jgi:general secretion pathway protein F